MSGVIILMDRLKAAALVTAIVPVERLYPGDFPLGFVPSAISLRSIDLAEHTPLAGAGVTTLCHDRVQVTVAAPTYTEMVDLMAVVRRSLRNIAGAIAGYNGVAVVPLEDGPDFELESNVQTRSKDYRVSFHETNS